MDSYLDSIHAAASYIKERIHEMPEIGLVLGSGWGDFADTVEAAVRIPYEEVPGFPKTSVAGHAGQWVFGTIGGRQVAVMSGRFHYYEGHDMRTITLPVRVMQALGVKTLILTNAAGGVNGDYEVGDLMLISDHISLTGASPLFGPNLDEFGPRFPDMTHAYDRDLKFMAHLVANGQGFRLREGVYAQMPGPCYETPAEIRMLRVLGADAVGMSTVPEVIAARHGGMRVMGVSCITNMAAGVLDQPLSHSEVVEAGQKAAGRVKAFLEEMIRRI